VDSTDKITIGATLVLQKKWITGGIIAVSHGIRALSMGSPTSGAIRGRVRGPKRKNASIRF